MGDFALENGKVSKGVLSSVLAAVKYLVIPAILVTILISIITGLGGDEYLPMSQLETVRTSLIIFALPAIAIAFFVGFYPKGSYSRMTFGIAYVAMVCVWLWFAALEGSIETSVEMVGIGLIFTPLLLLFIFALSLKALIYVAEAPSFRAEFLKMREERMAGTSPAEAPVAAVPNTSSEQVTSDPEPSAANPGSEPSVEGEPEPKVAVEAEPEVERESATDTRGTEASEKKDQGAEVHSSMITMPRPGGVQPPK